ncbi:hypothetical protein N9L68_07490 [bacterium]|nr:hypothetical protein [bacterium]
MKDILDQCQDLDEELTLGANAAGSGIDLGQLASDLSFVFIYKARVGSDILQRIRNTRKKGGVQMYADAYRWFTETSGLGLAEQAARLMDPKQASSEAGIAEAIESWQEKSDRLARHGEAHKPPEAYKDVAPKKTLVGKTREDFDFWESDKYSYDDIARKVKERARSKKLDKGAFTAKSGVALGNVESKYREQ